jgi:calcineurin-like phosphoesterase family protein
MALFVTSDTHFGHANILKYCNRPFKDVDHMNEEIVKRFNEVLTPDDTLLHLGDVVMGDREKNLAYMDRIKVGRKILQLGNHDEPWSGTKSESRRERYKPIYERHFDVVSYLPWGRIEDDSQPVNALGGHPLLAYYSHFPYEGDSQAEARYNNFRAKDETGTPIIHGHTHSPEKISYSPKGTLQVHVGVDAWDFYPVHMDTIKELIAEG